MFLHWNQNGTQRVWNLSEKNINRKLRKALKKAVLQYVGLSERAQQELGVQYANLCAAKNVADMHFAIYSLIGTPEFLFFEIKSEK
jgi:hypothetical protein